MKDANNLFNKDSFWPMVLSFMIMGSSGLQVFTNQTTSDSIKETVTSNITAEMKLYLRESFDRFGKEIESEYVTKQQHEKDLKYLEMRDAINGMPIPPGQTLLNDAGFQHKQASLSFQRR